MIRPLSGTRPSVHFTRNVSGRHQRPPITFWLAFTYARCVTLDLDEAAGEKKEREKTTPSIFATRKRLTMKLETLILVQKEIVVQNSVGFPCVSPTQHCLQCENFHH